MPRQPRHYPKRLYTLGIKLDGAEKALLARAVGTTDLACMPWAREVLMRAVREIVGEMVVGEAHPPAQ